MKDLVNQTKQQPAKQETKQKVPTKQLHALVATPRGKALFTYMLAAMSVLGGFTANRKVFKKESLRAFFQTGSAISHHTKNGNFEETKTGIRLTVTGWNYFNGRLTGSTVGQNVDEKEMKVLIQAIEAGKMPEKTERYSLETKFKAIKVK